MTENTVLDNNVSSIIKNSNNPIYRFKNEGNSVFPDWEEFKIGDLCTIYKGAPLSKADIADSGTPFILYGELYTTYGEIAYQINRKTEKIVDKKYYSKIGDVVVPTSGETAEEISTATCIMKDDVILAGDLNIFRGSKIDGRILSYLLNHKKKYEIASVAQGASIIHIKADDLKKIKINVPCKIEQEKIASFLTSIDNIISTQESNISILETYNKGLISKIFKQEIRFKDDNGNEFPDWEKVKLFDLVEHYGGTALEPLVIENGSCKFISIGNYSPNGKYIDNGQRINPVGKAKDKQLKKDDLVMVLNDKTKNGTIIGSTILIDDDNYIYNQRSERLICKKNVLPYFLWSYINSPLIKNKILQLVQGGTQIYVNFSSVYNMDMHLPIMEEQNKIANFLKQLDKILEQEKVYLEQLKTIKKGLLQQMFV